MRITSPSRVGQKGPNRDLSLSPRDQKKFGNGKSSINVSERGVYKKDKLRAADIFPGEKATEQLKSEEWDMT